MSLQISDNFSYQGRKPLDNRLVFNSADEMVSTPDSSLYSGLLAFVKSSGKYYTYNENNTSEAGTGKWREFTVSASSSDYTIPLYEQNVSYNQNELIYYGNYIARVLQDFISDNVKLTVTESWNEDVINGNLLILNEESEPGILPYTQGTFFHKDKLVFADGRIGRVLKDYISDSTGATIEESINIDIHNGNLREMAENYKFKLYKTTKDMNKIVDSINELPFSTIQFENGENIGNMQLNEGVYGPLGTLSIIQEIDVNNQVVKTKTVSSREMEFMPPAPDEYKISIDVAGSGYVVGDIFNSNINTLSVKVLAVGSTGEITSVELIERTTPLIHGTGAIVTASPIMYVGHAKTWTELPNNDNALDEPVKQYIGGNNYIKNTLIYGSAGLYSATVDFTATDIQSDIAAGKLLELSSTEVDVPACLGSYPTDEPDMLPQNPVQGNWCVIQNCSVTSPGNGGIGLYNGTNWDIIVLPQGEVQMEEPTTTNTLNFRMAEVSEAGSEGKWVEFTGIDGSQYQITIKQSTDSGYIPANGELVVYNNKVLLGDGLNNLMSLTPFYETTIDSNAITIALGYTPESVAEKGVAGGYAPLDANGKVPTANLPDSMTDTYTKFEIDTKETNLTNSLTSAINDESVRATGVETALDTKISDHIDNSAIHVTQSEKDSWDAKVDESDLTDFDNHIADTAIHVTQADKDKWNGANKAYFVTSAADLPTTENQIGNIGYVQTSAIGVTPIVCDQYIWTGTEWKMIDATGVSLDMKWGNIQDRPASTPLTIDNSVTVAHSHLNKTVLDKIGQTENGTFTFDNIPIGIRAVFCANDNTLPDEGEPDVLYVVYKDSRVRNFPSISVWNEGVFQVLGRGTQEAPPSVGEMSILQAEYFSVTSGSVFNITITPETSFCYLPVEILKEVAGAQNVTIEVINFNNSNNFIYNTNLFDITNNKYLQINNKELGTTVTTVGDYFFSEVSVDLSEYSDIKEIV